MTTSSQHVFQVLRTVAESEGARGVSDLARDVGLPTTTVHRDLQTLTEARFLQHDESTSRYRIGQMPMILLKALFSRFPIVDLAKPVLRNLASETGETISLSMRIGWYGVRVAAVPGTRDSLYKPRVGLTQLLHRTRAQSLVLAGLSDEDIAAYRRFVKREFPEYQAVTERPAFLRELRSVRAKGFATTLAPLGAGFQFAMPLRSVGETPIGLLHILGPAVSVENPPIDDRIRGWLAMRGEIEASLRSDPDKYKSPYAHIHPDEIRLRVNA
jgi:DNA-binding IclR family transcriptional regulator